MSQWHVQGRPETENELRARVKPRVEYDSGQPCLIPTEARFVSRRPRKTLVGFHDIPQDRWDAIFKHQ